MGKVKSGPRAHAAGMKKRAVAGGIGSPEKERPGYNDGCEHCKLDAI